jgi:hypothetical protein
LGVQIVVLTILTMASVGAATSGFGRSSRAFFPARYKPEPSYISPLLNSTFSQKFTDWLGLSFDLNQVVDSLKCGCSITITVSPMLKEGAHFGGGATAGAYLGRMGPVYGQSVFLHLCHAFLSAVNASSASSASPDRYGCNTIQHN